MTQLNLAGIFNAWIFNGGASSKAYIAAAVCLAESGGRTDAISASNDYGLWQINSANFPNLGLNKVTALDPNNSAKAAIRMSGDGQNWAAWCTCWVNPRRDCGHGNLPIPQAGSPAGDKLGLTTGAATAIGQVVAVAAGTPGLDSVSGAWSAYQSFTSLGLQGTYDLHKYITGLANGIPT